MSERGVHSVSAALAAPAGLAAPAARVVLLGASNVTRGLRAATGWIVRNLPAPTEVLVAAGRGRSYGLSSSFLGRTLVGITDCGLWRRLEAGDGAPTFALVSDVGNDLLYGAEVEDIAGWIAACLARLERARTRIVLARLPVGLLERVSPARFHVFRRLFFPGRTHGREELLERARRMNEALREVGRESGAVVYDPREEWYGLDPIHVAFGRRRRAFAGLMEPWLANRPEGLRGRHDAGRAPRIPLTLSFAAAEQRRLFGVDRERRQPAVRLACGTTVSFY